MRIGVYCTSIRQSRSRISVWFVERINVSPVFFCTDVPGQHGSSSAIRYYGILVKDQTHLYETIFCWLHRTRSSYLMSRQQISWRTFSPNSWTTRSWRPCWTRSSTSLLELLFKIIINICIINCTEGRVFVILLFFECAVCSTICLCFRLCAHIHVFQVFLIRDFYQIHSDMSFLKCMFWIIGLFYAKCLQRSPR